MFYHWLLVFKQVVRYCLWDSVRSVSLDMFRGVCLEKVQLCFYKARYIGANLRKGTAWRDRMNIYKKRDIINHIRSKGRLPTDQHGQVLPVNDLLVWFELNKCLNQEEQAHMKRELGLLIESQLFMDQLES